MNIILTAAADVVRTTREFGFGGFGSKVTAVTFSGSLSPNGPRETFVVNSPRRGFNCKDGAVSVTNRSGNWGNEPVTPAYYKVWNFQPHTIQTVKGGLAVWQHRA